MQAALGVGRPAVSKPVYRAIASSPPSAGVIESCPDRLYMFGTAAGRITRPGCRSFCVSWRSRVPPSHPGAMNHAIKHADVGRPAAFRKGVALLHSVPPLRVRRAAWAGQGRRMIAVIPQPEWGWAPKGNIMETKMNNIVNLIGRLGDKPVCRTLNDGARVATVSIATDDGYKGGDGKWVDRTTWHRVTVFGEKRVDYIEGHYAKGDLVHFQGRLSYSQWEKDGVKHYGTELIGSTSVLAAANREDKPTAKGKTRRERKAAEPNDLLDEEIPF